MVTRGEPSRAAAPCALTIAAGCPPLATPQSMYAVTDTLSGMTETATPGQDHAQFTSCGGGAAPTPASPPPASTKTPAPTPAPSSSPPAVTPPPSTPAPSGPTLEGPVVVGNETSTDVTYQVRKSTRPDASPQEDLIDERTPQTPNFRPWMRHCDCALSPRGSAVTWALTSHRPVVPQGDLKITKTCTTITVKEPSASRRG